MPNLLEQVRGGDPTTSLVWVGKSRRELKETFCSVPTVLELVR